MNESELTIQDLLKLLKDIVGGSEVKDTSELRLLKSPLSPIQEKQSKRT